MPDRLLPNAIVAGRLRIVNRLRWVVIVDLLAVGLGFALGPVEWSSASGYRIIHALPVPFQVWGWAWTVAAVVAVLGRRWPVLAVVGHGVAAAVFGFWGLALAVPPITGWGGPFHHLTLAAVHVWLAVIGLYDRAYPLRHPQRD